MSGNNDRLKTAADDTDVELSPIPLLEAARSREDETWESLAPRYGVTNPDPPWKVALYATFECLSERNALPTVERRNAEDRLVEALYSGTPAPEQQLLALAHTMLSRGLLSEKDLASHMMAVRSRLEPRWTEDRHIKRRSSRGLLGQRSGSLPSAHYRVRGPKALA